MIENQSGSLSKDLLLIPMQTFIKIAFKTIHFFEQCVIFFNITGLINKKLFKFCSL